MVGASVSTTVQFFQEEALTRGLTNTLIYAVVTSGLKVVLGLLLAVLLTAPIIARGALGAVLPRTGQHDRRRADLLDSHAPHRRAHQPCTGGLWYRRTWLVDPT